MNEEEKKKNKQKGGTRNKANKDCLKKSFKSTNKLMRFNVFPKPIKCNEFLDQEKLKILELIMSATIKEVLKNQKTNN